MHNKEIEELKKESYMLIKRYQQCKSLALGNLIMKEYEAVERRIDELSARCEHV